MARNTASDALEQKDAENPLTMVDDLSNVSHSNRHAPSAGKQGPRRGSGCAVQVRYSGYDGFYGKS